MIVGGPLTFDLRTQNIERQEFVVFEIDDASGRVAVCKWEADANPLQVAAALERLCKKLRDPNL